MKPTQSMMLLADKLRSISAMGLIFSHNIYDLERYRELQNISMEIMSLATGDSLEQLELLRTTVFANPSPIPTVDAAIINEQGQILLIQRADNSKWAMPGGAVSVGETPAEAAVREAFEETGIRCEPTALVGVFDSRFCGTVSRHHLYQLLFLCRPLANGHHTPPSHVQEVLNMAWFAEKDLPSDIDPGHITRIPKAFCAWCGDAPYFDWQYPVNTVNHLKEDNGAHPTQTTS